LDGTCAPGEFAATALASRVAIGPSNGGDVLSDSQLRTLAAAMERILPAGDDPGASDANAIGFVEWMMRQGSSASVVADLEAALTFIDSLAMALCQREFVACGPEQQKLVLQRMEATPHPRVQRYFGILVKTTLAGFLCPPEYGGNRDERGWRSIGHTPRVGRIVDELAGEETGA
jgi:hypothetical protein